MHRTQIYFEENTFEELKHIAKRSNTSVSAYIRTLVDEDLKKQTQIQTAPDFSDVAGLWSDHDISQDSLRESAWK